MRKSILVKTLLLLPVASFASGISSSEYKALADTLVPGAEFGLSIRSIRTNQEIASIASDSFFTPASTLKTLTTAAAITFFSPDYQPRTTMHLDGSINGKTFFGVLRLRGEGDPNISARFYSEPLYLLHVLADSIRAKGIDTLNAKIELDTTYFSGPRKPEHWRSNYFNSWYGAEIAPFAFNDNCALVLLSPGEKPGDPAIISIEPDVGYVQIKNTLQTIAGKKRSWKYALDPELPIITLSGNIGDKTSGTLVIPVRNPNRYFEAAFKKALADQGLVFIENKHAQSGIEIYSAEVSGAPVLSILDEINQRSQNLHAEMLFRDMAAKKYREGSTENGIRADKDFLQKMDLNPNDFKPYDGCGLSPLNKVKPRAETELLAKMARSAKGPYYIESFASPGIGSGGKRMPTLEFPWKVRFKTGYIANTHALVGYIYTIDDDTLAIATYLNNTGNIPDHKSKELLDSVWERTARAANDHYATLIKMKSLYIQGTSVNGLSNRLKYFSGLFLDTPYLIGPTGESYVDTTEAKPLINTDSVDCVTFIEHVLALAKSTNEDNIFSTLMKIRYFDGKISYRTRKHYFVEDWLGEGKLAKALSLPGDTTIVRHIPKNDFFKAKNISYGKPDPDLYLRYLPLNKAIDFAKTPWQGESTVRGVAFVSANSTIDAFHTGFLILDKGKKPLLRHASQTAKKVTDRDFEDYLNSWVGTGKVPGIVLFEFLE
ncbi:MAG: D-alanyl-D-alanine carboxypeptidase/D-alanyl-D-alanine-endopeptidase [Fibrobacteraceae bacterium]|nr:D-alanyl-D-alanine carboxypeptidase/D-alanyl-D-alanine-endopeptidase [Fibrobacteraceae bacterium]